MTDLKTLKQLVKLMADNDLTELDLEGEGEKIKLRRGRAVPEVQYVAPPSAAPAPVAAAPASAPAGGAEPKDDGLEDGAVTIDCPMVGTYYSSPTPDAATFVKVGDTVDAETVICIVEAMKVFNEIKAEKSGTIQRILVDNGQVVEFGQPLFVIKPN